MTGKSKQQRVPFVSKLAYGMGDVGCNFSWMFVGNFLMIFTRPLTVVFALFIFVSLGWPVIRKQMKKRRASEEGV